MVSAIVIFCVSLGVVSLRANQSFLCWRLTLIASDKDFFYVYDLYIDIEIRSLKAQITFIRSVTSNVFNIHIYILYKTLLHS